MLQYIPLALGVAQTIAGVALPKGKRPSWQIPGAAEESLGMARQQAMSTTRPGEAEFRQQLDQSAAQAVGTAQRVSGSGSQILAAAQGANSNRNRALIQNSAMNQQYRFNAKQNLQGTLDRFAGYQREKFVKDVMEPYQERAKTKEMLIGAGLQNTFGSIKSMQEQGLQSKYLDYLSSPGAGYGGSGNTSPSGGIPNWISMPGNSWTGWTG